MYTIRMFRFTFIDGKYKQYWEVVASFKYKQAAEIALKALQKSWHSTEFQLTCEDKLSK